jgi:hypothetical protein
MFTNSDAAFIGWQETSSAFEYSSNAAAAGKNNEVEI